MFFDVDVGIGELCTHKVKESKRVEVSLRAQIQQRNDPMISHITHHSSKHDVIIVEWNNCQHTATSMSQCGVVLFVIADVVLFVYIVLLLLFFSLVF